MSNSKRKSHCGKLKHPTLLAAQAAARRTVAHSRKGDPIVTGLAAYKCSFCDGYHVGRSQRKGINWDEIRRQEEHLANLRSQRAFADGPPCSAKM